VKGSDTLPPVSI